MSKSIREHLEQKFPLFYKDNQLKTYGCDFGDGWLPLIEKCSQEIEDLIKARPDLPKPIPAQIKEKFGSLRFYIDEHSPEVDAIIDKAENESMVTCEICGQPGEVRNTGWLKCLCEEHFKKRQVT